ncbi:MAG: hypothetical protein EOM91_02035 [Sphingobacteriia bacterium]|nr:hypothetical protein [Sphingobacteriia bacterium]NCC38496.1 hypothetical protein [Gammaproteobacteria bacterium]
MQPPIDLIATDDPAEPDWSSASIRRYAVPNGGPINRAILAVLERLDDQEFDHRSHYIGGRFENLYLDRTRVPALIPLLDHAIRCAGWILDRSPRTLKCGFWFNRMAPGQSTSRHTHEEHDELLSAVYYLSVPADSGDLLLYDGPAEIRVRPREGCFVFFPPDLPHAVEVNRARLPRWSIGINIGPA